MRRFNLAQEPATFIEDAAVEALLDRPGSDESPAIVAGDKLNASRRYLGRDELAALARLITTRAGVEMTEQIEELVVFGAAIGASGDPCFKIHDDKARKLEVSPEALREAVRIGERVEQASAKNILGLAARMFGTGEPTKASSSCCGGASAPEPRAKSGCYRCGCWSKT